jgi:hypothetical protein
MNNPRRLVVQGICHPMSCYYLYPNQCKASHRHHCHCSSLTAHCSWETHSTQAFYHRLVDADWVCARRHSRQASYHHLDMGWACTTTHSMREFCHRPQDSASCQKSSKLVFYHHHHPMDLVCNFLLLLPMRHPIDKDWCSCRRSRGLETSLCKIRIIRFIERDQRSIGSVRTRLSITTSRLIMQYLQFAVEFSSVLSHLRPFVDE